MFELNENLDVSVKRVESWIWGWNGV